MREISENVKLFEVPQVASDLNACLSFGLRILTFSILQLKTGQLFSFRPTCHESSINPLGMHVLLVLIVSLLYLYRDKFRRDSG
jgi:hypothetical protein